MTKREEAKIQVRFQPRKITKLNLVSHMWEIHTDMEIPKLVRQHGVYMTS